jgi:mutator protein MutT
MTSIPHKKIGVAVIWNDLGDILIDRRLDGGLMGGLWEFPGGKLEPGETIIQCIHREIQEELAIEITVGDPLITIDHDYGDFTVTLFVHNCQYVSGEPQLLESTEVRWVKVDQLSDYQFPQANQAIIQAIASIGT